MPAGVAVAQGRQHIGDVASLQNQHAQLTLQSFDLVVLSDGGVSRHLRFELAGLLFQLRNVRVQLSAEVLGLPHVGGHALFPHAPDGNPPSSNSAVRQQNWPEMFDAAFAGTAPYDRFGT
jgi:hypothetical protein